MAQSIKNRVFGSDVPQWLKDRIKNRQMSSINVEFGEESYPYGSTGMPALGQPANLSSKTPFARVWTALQFFKKVTETLGEDSMDGAYEEFSWEPVGEDVEPKIYELGNHTLNTLYAKENESVEIKSSKVTSDIVKAVIPYEQESDENLFLRPPAGITSISSETEGELGALKRTTINFIVYNSADFEQIYLRYFLKPGAQMFIDFGWNSADLYNPRDLLKSTDFEDFLFGDTGVIVKGKGEMEVLFGHVVNFDATMREDGGHDCMVEVISKNAAILNQKMSFSDQNRIKGNLDSEVMAAGISGITGDPMFYNAAVKAGRRKTYGPDDEGKIVIMDDPLAKVAGEILALAKDMFGGGLLPGTLEGKGWGNSNLASRVGIWIDSQSNVFINWGLFEDIILNKEFGFSDNEKDLVNDTIGGSNGDEGKLFPKFNSRNSFVGYDTNLITMMKAHGVQWSRDFIYPQNWGKGNNLTYNIERGMVPDRYVDGVVKKAIWGDKEEETKWYDEWQDNDIAQMKIPFREIFVKLELIKSSLNQSYSSTEFVQKILNQINIDSETKFQLGLSSNSYGSHTISICDKNAFGIHSDEAPDRANDKKVFLDKLLEFHPFSKTTIIKGFDLSFAAPQGGLGDMLAIQALGPNENIKPATEFVKAYDKFIKLEKKNDYSDLEDVYIKTLPSIGDAAGERLKVASLTGPEQSKTIFDSLYTRRKNPIKSSTYSSYEHKIEAARIQLYEMMKSYDPQQKPPPDKNFKYEKNILYAMGATDTRTFTVENADADSETLSRKIGYRLCMGPGDYETKMVGHFVGKIIPAVYPLEFSLKMYGCAGFLPGDFIRISALPSYYYNNVYFQIMKVSHEVGETWDTSFETVMRIYPDFTDFDDTPLEDVARIRKSYLYKGLELTHNIESYMEFFGDLEPITYGADSLSEGMNLFKTKIIRKPDTDVKALMEMNFMTYKGLTTTKPGKDIFGEPLPSKKNPSEDTKDVGLVEEMAVFATLVTKVNDLFAKHNYPELVLTHWAEWGSIDISSALNYKGWNGKTLDGTYTISPAMQNVAILTLKPGSAEGFTPEHGKETIWILTSGESWLPLPFNPLGNEDDMNLLKNFFTHTKSLKGPLSGDYNGDYSIELKMKGDIDLRGKLPKEEQNIALDNTIGMMRVTIGDQWVFLNGGGMEYARTAGGTFDDGWFTVTNDGQVGERVTVDMYEPLNEEEMGGVKVLQAKGLLPMDPTTYFSDEGAYMTRIYLHTIPFGVSKEDAEKMVFGD